MALSTKVKDLESSDQTLLANIKGQMSANQKGHDDYVKARDAGDKAGMDLNQPSFNAYEQYADQYRAEASRLGVSDVPEDVPIAVTSPAMPDKGDKVPAKPDKDFTGPVTGGGAVT
jgi:hypothetical protein